ncbi:hypothetical protein C8J57DRAFT_1522527 [Mycena rebaudengoi]|nr:hypothetical protein C8J57DRAFT_1522527 [Mycena rebaudengoi]
MAKERRTATPSKFPLLSVGRFIMMHAFSGMDYLPSHSAAPNATRSSSLDTPRAVPCDRSHPRAATHNATNSNYVYNPSLLNTPTPSSRYPPPLRPAPAHPQFVIPEERTQMDRLLDMMQLVLKDTAELKERVSVIETTLSQLQSHPPARGMAAQRGGRITQSKRAALRSRQSQLITRRSNDESDAETLDLSTGTDREPESADDDGVDLDTIDISKPERRALQSYVSKTFRRVCNVPGRNWPNPDIVRTNPVTDEVYPTPIFSVTVKDHRNKDIFQDVAHRPQALQRPLHLAGPTFDRAFLRELCKNSFRSFKKQWNEFQKIEAAIQVDENRCSHRRTMRRQRKSRQLAEIVNAFAAKFGLDPAFLADLIHEQFLSDEVSGPEDNSGESKEAWKVRLAASAKLPLGPDAQRKLELLEILVPKWRADSASKILE